MLQLMVKRLRQTNVRYQLRHRPPAVKLANTLVELAENYGQTTEKKCEIFNISDQDLADVTDITIEQTNKIMEKLHSKGWISREPEDQLIKLLNLKNLKHLASQ